MYRDMPLLPDIHGFEGLPTFPAEIATFRKGTLMILLNLQESTNIMMFF